VPAAPSSSIRAGAKHASDDARRADHAARTFDVGNVDDLNALVASGFRARDFLIDPPWKFMTRSVQGEGRSANPRWELWGIKPPHRRETYYGSQEWKAPCGYGAQA
jgi:hypothetical protein